MILMLQNYFVKCTLTNQSVQYTTTNMDDALSRLMPNQRIGYDGFPWWVGQVEGTASDEETSGVYLIRKIKHKYDFTDGLDGICKTTLELFRDSYGVKDLPSNRGNK